MMAEINTPLISIVTASFNALDGLRKTVQSISGQSFDSVEHIVIDGGSTDGTGEYLEGLGDGLRWISEPDDGIGDALNKGVAMARGTYVIILQAEDSFVSEDSLMQVEKALRSGEDILSCAVLVESGNGDRREVRSHGLGWRSNFHMTLPHQGAFCRKDLFDRIGQFDCSYAIAMDYDFFLRAKAVGASFRCIDRAISVMPATGISSRLDWPGMAARLTEFRRAQTSHASWHFRPVLALYWALYWPYKRLRSLVLQA